MPLNGMGRSNTSRHCALVKVIKLQVWRFTVLGAKRPASRIARKSSLSISSSVNDSAAAAAEDEIHCFLGALFFSDLRLTSKKRKKFLKILIMVLFNPSHSNKERLLKADSYCYIFLYICLNIKL